MNLFPSLTGKFLNRECKTRDASNGCVTSDKVMGGCLKITPCNMEHQNAANPTGCKDSRIGCLGGDTCW